MKLTVVGAVLIAGVAIASVLLILVLTANKNEINNQQTAGFPQ